jgi:sulfoxide reductase heme-binding subunit YedZ
MTLFAKLPKLWGPLLALEGLAVAGGILSYRLLAGTPGLYGVGPWVVARAAGIGAYGLLTVLVLLGLGMSHPSVQRLLNRAFFPYHQMLALGVLALVAVHGAALAWDRYAGVGWAGLVVPGISGYRPGPVALGVVAAEAMVWIAATAHLTYNMRRLRWITVHRLALVVFALVWAHGVWAGTDSVPLADFYRVTGLAVGMAAAWRYGVERRRPAGAPRARSGDGSSPAPAAVGEELRP